MSVISTFYGLWEELHDYLSYNKISKYYEERGYTPTVVDLWLRVWTYVKEHEYEIELTEIKDWISYCQSLGLTSYCPFSGRWDRV